MANTVRNSVQKFGRTLSAMVMPNIGAFIAWGLIMALFIPNGWIPSEKLAQIGPPMMNYLLPLLIAYTAGSNVCGMRGGITGAIATVGVIAGSDIPMFIGAMIMGPLGGLCIRIFDRWVEGKVKAGFEMIVNNFSIGIIGLLLSLVGFLLVGGIVEWFTGILTAAVQWLLSKGLLPLVSVLVEPGKVMFLNNAINHGICDIIGVQQVQEFGKSVYFLIEANPGPGLGVLLACWVSGRGDTRQSAPGAAIIHFFGGIHEIYFPYILAQPTLLLATICGGASALLFYSITGAGLVAPASPGSIIALLAMAPKGQTLLVLAGVLIATAISFLIAMPIVRLGGRDQGADTLEADDLSLSGDGRTHIVFACDAGMGSSALGATRFKSRLMKFGLGSLRCDNSAVDAIPASATVVVCQRALQERARATVPAGTTVVVIDNFLSDPALDKLLEVLCQTEDKRSTTRLNAPIADSKSVPPANSLSYDGSDTASSVTPEGVSRHESEESDLLKLGNILVGLPSEDKEQAILRAGTLLVRSGYVSDSYPAAMLERERITGTCMGMGLAIPHGTSEAKDSVLHSGIVVLQYPDGIEWGDGEVVRLVIGIAGVGNEHLDILSRLATVLENEAITEQLQHTTDPGTILHHLSLS